jgi:hypothetical protein
MFFTVSKLALGPICPLINKIMAVKQPRHEAGNSIPSTTEVKNVCGAKPPPSQSTRHGA